MTTLQTMPALNCACGKPARPWKGIGMMPRTCESCRIRDQREAEALSLWKWKQARAPRKLSNGRDQVRRRNAARARLEAGGKVRCACGRQMYRLTTVNTIRERCERCRCRESIGAINARKGAG